jgi:hypothetical protein
LAGSTVHSAHLVALEVVHAAVGLVARDVPHLGVLAEGRPVARLVRGLALERAVVAELHRPAGVHRQPAERVVAGLELHARYSRIGSFVLRNSSTSNRPKFTPSRITSTCPVSIVMKRSMKFRKSRCT